MLQWVKLKYGRGFQNPLQKVVRMRFVLMSLFTLSAIAQTSTDVSNGHLIPEPQLADYHYATRAPGILSEPFEIIDQSGNPSQ